MEIEQLMARDVFLLSVELRLFWTVVGLYFLSSLIFFFSLISVRADMGEKAISLLWIGAFMHTVLILLRTLEGGRPPFQSLYECLSWFAWSCVITYLLFHRRLEVSWLPGIVVATLAMGSSLFALARRDPFIEPLSPALQSHWFIWHVALAFLSYAVFVVSASFEIVYLCFCPALRRGRGRGYGVSVQGLEIFHRKAHQLVLFGFPLLTFGIVSGAMWANEAWGRYWAWDPKETWSLITWLVYCLYLHSRIIPRWEGLRSCSLNVLGFICMIMTFLGVNWLAKILGIPSLHTYDM